MAMLGLAQFEAALQKVAADADATAKASIAKAVALVESGAKHNFAGSHRKGEPHVPAFADGQPVPNVVTGTWRRSIRHDPIERLALGDYRTVVGPRAVYARRDELDYGYAVFAPAARAVQPKFGEIAAELWGRFLHL